MSPRSAGLKPKESVSRKAAGLASWVVSVPPAISDTGKRSQRFFRTKSEAQVMCEDLKFRRFKFGHSLRSMTPELIAEASEAYDILAPLKVGLLDAVRAFVTDHQARHSSVTLQTLFIAYIEEKADRHPRYLEQLRMTLNRMPQLQERMVSDIGHREIDEILRPLSPGARNPLMRYLKTVFRYGIKKGYLTENPIDRLDFVRRPRKEVETVPIDEVSRMLNYALDHDLGLLPFLTLGFFCGIRPENELLKLEWSDLQGTEIVIRPEVSKTNRRRFVDIPPNAYAWLTAYGDRGGVTTGKIVRYTLANLQHRHRKLRKACGISKWPNSGCRHTFCSCWLAVRQDVNKLVLMSGHDSPDVMWRQYHRGVPKVEAEKFWSIMPPPTEERKIIRIG
jgi:integrase